MQTREIWTCLLLLLVSVSGWAGTGCGNQAVSAGADPVHLHLFCGGGADGQTLTCEGTQRLAHFNAWVKEAVYRPHSTFSIWAVGPDRSGSRRFFGVCIPERWGAAVWKAKSDFMALARQGALGSQSGLAVPAECHAPGPQTPGRNQLAVSSDVAVLPADILHTLVFPSVAPALHLGIVCDRSESTLGAVCTPAAVLRAFDLWVTEGLLLPGATLSVEMVGPLRGAVRSVFHLTVPDLPVGERVAFALGARAELARLFSGSGEKYASTIAEAISATVRRLRERRGRYQLFVFSDMHQITTGVWNFEQALPTPDEFLVWLKKTQLFADLRDIPVLACGLHTGYFVHYSAAHATRLQDVWRRAFQAMGSREVRLFGECDAAFAAS
jgi:hypothetical protein